MNNTPFEIQKTETNRWAVLWLKFKNIRDMETGIKLLDILFGQMKCYEVGLALLLNNGEYDTLWIDYKVWAQHSNRYYSEYLQDMYEIRGVLFHKESEALQLQDILEKKYIWKVLQA